MFYTILISLAHPACGFGHHSLFFTKGDIHLEQVASIFCVSLT